MAEVLQDGLFQWQIDRNKLLKSLTQGCEYANTEDPETAQILAALSEVIGQTQDRIFGMEHKRLIEEAIKELDAMTLTLKDFIEGNTKGVDPRILLGTSRIRERARMLIREGTQMPEEYTEKRISTNELKEQAQVKVHREAYRNSYDNLDTEVSFQVHPNGNFVYVFTSEVLLDAGESPVYLGWDPEIAEQVFEEAREMSKQGQSFEQIHQAISEYDDRSYANVVC